MVDLSAAQLRKKAEEVRTVADGTKNSRETFRRLVDSYDSLADRVEGPGAAPRGERAYSGGGLDRKAETPDDRIDRGRAQSRTALATVLGETGYNVMCAASGAEAAPLDLLLVHEGAVSDAHR